MDKQYSWKRTEDIEIEIADFLQKLCIQWKKIAVCALVFAVVSGGYRWLSTRNVPQQNVSDLTEETDLTEEEQQKVADAVQLQKETSSLQEYLDHSILMQLDAYHKNRYIMLYRIEQAGRNDLRAILESYLNYIANGGMADALLKSGSSWRMDKSCLAELITAYQRTYSSPYQFVADESAESSRNSEILFYVDVTGRNAQSAKKMALDIQKILKQYSAAAEKNAGSHRLALINSVECMTADSGLQTQQHDKKAQLASNEANLKAMTEAFNEKQMETYQKAAGIKAEEKEKDGQEEMEENISGESQSSVVKYIFFGLAGGIFGYCCIFLCWYVFSDKIKSVREMKRLYTFPVYGEMMLNERSGKYGSRMSAKQQNICEYKKSQILNRIRLACEKKGIKYIYAASGCPLHEQEKKYLESIAKQLKTWGITLSAAENAITDTQLWDGLKEAEMSFWCAGVSTTTRRMIDDEMEFYLQNGITVMGAAVFSQNRK